MSSKKNPATCDRGRDLVINAVGTAIVDHHPKGLQSGFQSGSYAASVLQERFRLPPWYARLLCRLYGFGGAE
jgi:hypothetical protein